MAIVSAKLACYVTMYQKVKLSLIAIVGRVKRGELAHIGASPAKYAGRGHDSRQIYAVERRREIDNPSIKHDNNLGRRSSFHSPVQSTSPVP